MQTLFWKKAAVAILALVVIALAALLVFGSRKTVEVPAPAPIIAATPVRKVIGKSVEGRQIESFTYGTGAKKIVFVGGIHGGYEWNSVALAREFMNYLTSHTSAIPANETVIIIPDLNPDAVYKVTGKTGNFDAADVSSDAKLLTSARFNANGVDLNRNFDCNWQPKSTWQSKTVSAGTSAFSEPEAVAFRDFVESENPDAVVFWHSQANAIYGSSCGEPVSSGTHALMSAYKKASGYEAHDAFGAYQTTGAAEDWLAKIGIPAITVELSSHASLDWDKNLAGSLAVIDSFK